MVAGEDAVVSKEMAVSGDVVAVEEAVAVTMQLQEKRWLQV